VPHDAAPAFADRLRAIEYLVLDVDGVLTDGGIIYGDAGIVCIHAMRAGSAA